MALPDREIYAPLSHSLNPRLISRSIQGSEGRDRIFIIGFLATMAIFLSIIEHMVPKPLPWMRVGLANAITLYAFTYMKPKEVFFIVLSRMIAASLFVGSFLSIGFLLSLVGSLSSFCVMYLLFKLFQRFFSLIGISIIGALTSNTSQFLLINILFTNSRLFFYFLPFILLFALIGGSVSGIFGRFLVENI